MHAPEKYVSRFAQLPLEKRIYAAMVAAVDDGIGSIVDTLRRNGQLENTLLFFVGDNGATTEKRAGLNQQYAVAGSNGKFRGFKFSLFDGGMHVPGFVHWPSKGKARTLPQLAQSMDILPTALAAAGLPAPADMDGHSLLPTLTQNAPSPHQELMWTNQGQLAIRRGPWKLVIGGKDFDRRPEGNQALTGDDALFLSNLDEDPAQYTLPASNTLQIRSWPLMNTIPYVMQWNLSIQKELGRDYVWEVNYVGNSGVKLYGAYEGNQPLPGPGGVNTRRPLRTITSGSILTMAPRVNSKYNGISTRGPQRWRRLRCRRRPDHGQLQPQSELRAGRPSHRPPLCLQRPVGAALRQGQELGHFRRGRCHLRRLGIGRHHHPFHRPAHHPNAEL